MRMTIVRYWFARLQLRFFSDRREQIFHSLKVAEQMGDRQRQLEYLRETGVYEVKVERARSRVTRLEAELENRA